MYFTGKRVILLVSSLILCGISLQLIAPMVSWAASKTVEEEIAGALATLNKAIQDNNDPMRNRMYFKFRLIEQDQPGTVAQPLIENLKSTIPGVPEYTAFILGWIADKKAVQPLVDMLSGADSFKRAALLALGNMEAKEAFDAMAKLLGDSSDPVRRDAAYALGILGDDRAIPLLKPLVNDKDELVRFLANEAIERIENRKKYGW